MATISPPSPLLKWRKLDLVRYKNYSGGLIFPNFQYPCRENLAGEMKSIPKKNKLCSLYGATREKIECFAIKYILMKGKIAYAYHWGQHQSRDKLMYQRQVDIIYQALKSNPTIKPIAIQRQTVLTVLHSRENLDQVLNIAKKITHKV